MLVDEHATTRKLVRLALEDAGFSVQEARDGATALSLMKVHEPALVVQDLALPDMDGLELAPQLRELAGERPLRVIACSGLVSNLDAKRIVSVGFDDIVAKPVAPSRLCSLIEAHLAQLEPAPDQFGAGKHLLLVEDDPLQLQLASFRLTRLGFAIETAHHGNEALERARRTPPDVIVSDVLMPELDGFGLAVALRRDAALRSIPLVLLTSSYVEASDRELARRVGADDFVLRTPDLEELARALRKVIARGASQSRQSTPVSEELEREHARRTVRQLERQLTHASELMRRCSLLSAELTILTSLSEAVLKHHDVESALAGALASCFDASKDTYGALYLLDAQERLRVRSLGAPHETDGADLASFFGHEAWLRDLIARGSSVVLSPATTGPREVVARVLSRAQARRALVIPLVHLGRPLGALFVAKREEEHALEFDQWRLFAHGVASQITQALALADAFRQREVAEREAEEQKCLAREQAAVWRALVEHAPDVVMHLDLAGRLRFSNRPRPGRTWDGDDEVSWFDLMSPECHTEMQAALATVIAQGIPQTIETRRHVESGMLWIESHLGPIHMGAQVVGVLVIERDVTLKKQTEAQLIIADRMASVGNLAAGVAHEINNPLASVLANLDLAQREIADLHGISEDLSDELRDAREGAERVRRIVRDLKIFSRIDEDKRGPVEVARVLDSALRMAWNEIRHRARLVKDYQPVPLVEANEARLGQVFLNLIMNAAHAIKEGAADKNEIRVSLRLHDGKVLVCVEDTGSGIAPNHEARLFTPFFTTKPPGVGTGLGLSICHRIVTSLGGTISLSTELGRGTVVRVALLPRPDLASSTPAARPAATPARRRGRVLVIDDEPMIAQVVRRALARDHEVLTLDRADLAVARITSGERFDVIVCDLLMPELSGMDFHRELARAYPDQAERIVFFTGGAFTEQAREFLERVDNPRLEKPLDAHELRALINGLIR